MALVFAVTSGRRRSVTGKTGRPIRDHLPTHGMFNSRDRDTSAEQNTLLLRLIDLAQTLSVVLSLFASRHKLSENDCYALAVLSRHDAITAKSLGLLCHMHKPVVSRVLRSLVQRKLVTREQNHLDRRKVTIVLTPGGVVVGREIVQAAAALADRLEQTMLPAERADLHDALVQITDRMKAIVRIDTASPRPRQASSAALN
jgi:DNA-binding MarR family transcriptional regulator